MSTISCDRVSDALGASETLSPELAEHARTCPACVARVTGAKALRGLLADTRATQLDARVKARQSAALLTELQTRGRSRRYAALVLVPLAVALIAGVVWPLLPRGPEPSLRVEVLGRSGDASVIRQGRREALTAQASCATGELVDTGDGHAVLGLGTDRVDVARHSAARVEELEALRARVTLERGALVARVEPNRPEREFSVTAPFGVVRVRGTVFRVDADADTIVVTWRGRVDVSLSGPTREIEVPAGFALMRDGALRRLRGDELEPPADPAAALEPWREPEREPESEAEPVVEPSKEPRWRETRARSPKPAAVKAPEKDSAPTVDEACALERTRLADAPNERQPALLLALAQCQLGRGDTLGALETLRRIEHDHPASTAAESALFEANGLAERLGRVDEARRGADLYLARYARGAFRPDARFQLCRLDIRARDFAAAAACLDGLRRDHPTWSRVDDALFLQATVYKDGFGNCARAAELFGEYLTRVKGDKREMAAYDRASCWRGRDRTALERAAQTYLEEFPRSPRAPEVSGWLR